MNLHNDYNEMRRVEMSVRPKSTVFTMIAPLTDMPALLQLQLNQQL